MPALRPVTEGSLADEAAAQLRAAIRSGAYPPGARLVERALAAELGVSHIPVREALAQLAEEGLVERTPRRGARVAQLSDRALDEISSLRVVLEQLVVERVQERLTAEHQRELREVVQHMHAAVEAGDIGAVFACDERFHTRLWTLADHALLLDVASQLRGRISQFLRAAIAGCDEAELRGLVVAHAELLDVIASGDRPAARAAMRHHIELAEARLRGSGTRPSGPEVAA